MTDTPILQVSGITKNFGGIVALNDVSFDVKEGEILGIIGPNGSGKTTIVNCISGFVKTSAGRVLFRGKNITGKPPHKIAQMGVLRTFQVMRPYYSLPAYKNLVIPLCSPPGETHRRLAGWRQAGRSKYGKYRHPGRDRLRAGLLRSLQDHQHPAHRLPQTFGAGQMPGLEARADHLR